MKITTTLTFQIYEMCTSFNSYNPKQILFHLWYLNIYRSTPFLQNYWKLCTITQYNFNFEGVGCLLHAWLLRGKTCELCPHYALR